RAAVRLGVRAGLARRGRARCLPRERVRREGRRCHRAAPGVPLAQHDDRPGARRARRAAVTVAAQIRALRSGAVVGAGDHLACVRVRGAGAHDLLDRVSPRELFVRSGQLLHTVLLDDAALPIADVYIGCDDDDYLVIAEGMSGPAVADFLAAHARGLDAAIEDTSASHAFLCLGGPYAWELLAELTTPDVIGLPYLGFFHEPRFSCFRAGKTGEYGYDLWVERGRLA